MPLAGSVSCISLFDPRLFLYAFRKLKAAILYKTTLETLDYFGHVDFKTMDFFCADLFSICQTCVFDVCVSLGYRNTTLRLGQLQEALNDKKSTVNSLTAK